MRRFAPAVFLLLVAPCALLAGVIPAEPLKIGPEPQFLMDLYVIDTTWGLKSKGEPVRRVFHPMTKHPGNPVLTGDDPSHLWPIQEPDGRIRMYYQLNIQGRGTKGAYRTGVALAESTDGVQWSKPALNLFADAAKLGLPANTVLHTSEHPQCEEGAPVILDLPEKDRKGYRHVMQYLMRGAPLFGIRLIGSQDGIHWDPAGDTLIAKLPSDTHNTLVFDPVRNRYNLYCRSKHIYRAGGETPEMIDTGESRRGISLLTNADLWSGWKINPQTILMPDELDSKTKFDYTMAMPVARKHGVYWGFLAPFLWNDLYASELAWSRDGVNFDRMAVRSAMIPFGPDGSWDQSMIVASPNWIDRGDQWYVYYAGWGGPHNSKERRGAIGLATIRKEGFISQHAPATGGVVCTRSLIWPGGDLLVNIDAQKGALQVRVSDELRKPIQGFNYADNPAFTGDNVRQKVTWNGRSLDELKGRVIRLEFFLKNADLYAFKAG